MKILMLGWELPPHNSGGLGVACYQIAKHLALTGVSIDFVLPYDAPHEKAEKFMKIHSAIKASPEQLQLPGAYQSYCFTCTDHTSCTHAVPSSLREQQHHYTQFVERLVVKKDDIDVIHAHDWLTYEAGMRAKELTGKPLVAHVHATEFDRSGEHYGNQLVHDIEYQGLMMADRIIAVSQVTKDIIVKEYGIPADKIDVIHNSIDQEEFEYGSGQSMYVYLDEMKKRGYTIVVNIGRLTVQKGLVYLLEAAKKAISVQPKLLFLIAGSGEQRDELLQRSAELGISQNILFTGFVRGKAWRDAYAVGDIFVMPSVSEPFGLTALEAAGYDNAILISKQSGAKEVLQNKLTFDFWDSTRLADQIVAITQHENLRNLLRTGASDEFARLSWHDATKKLVKLYDGTVPVKRVRVLA
jgi:glycogen(starch) synthase